ncbi:MAG: VOC family protein [Acidimicrobiia bacterium]
MVDRPTRRVDHVVHAVEDLEAAAIAYRDLGFTVTPRADHPFGTSNRLVVLDRSYLEIVAVTRPENLPITGFAARVAQHLLHQGQGITHVVLSSDHPEADLETVGDLATGEIFSFSRPAPQLEGPAITAEFACVLLEAPADLGMFLCHHAVPEAVWNEAAMHHPNGARALSAVTLPVEIPSLETLAMAAGVTGYGGGALDLAGVAFETGPAAIHFDVAVAATHFAGVDIGG